MTVYLLALPVPDRRHFQCLFCPSGYKAPRSWQHVSALRSRKYRCPVPRIPPHLRAHRHPLNTWVYWMVEDPLFALLCQVLHSSVPRCSTHQSHNRQILKLSDILPIVSASQGKHHPAQWHIAPALAFDVLSGIFPPIGGYVPSPPRPFPCFRYGRCIHPELLQVFIELNRRPGGSGFGTNA